MFDEATVCKLWDYVDGVKNGVTREEQEATAAAKTEETAPVEEVAAPKPEGKKKKGVCARASEARGACF